MKLVKDGPWRLIVLGGSMRAMGSNVGNSYEGILTDRTRQLTNDFFANLIDMDTVWGRST